MSKHTQKPEGFLAAYLPGPQLGFTSVGLGSDVSGAGGPIGETGPNASFKSFINGITAVRFIFLRTCPKSL